MKLFSGFRRHLILFLFVSSAVSLSICLKYSEDVNVSEAFTSASVMMRHNTTFWKPSFMYDFGSILRLAEYDRDVYNVVKSYISLKSNETNNDTGFKQRLKFMYR